MSVKLYEMGRMGSAPCRPTCRYGAAGQGAVEALGDQGGDALQPGVEAVHVQRRRIDVQVVGVA